ncbi:response regulator [Micrococcoides hystricis]|uniref:Response regulator n=1 Tax=Micrococcoides hystricis TaxID=1572761 RepID=A0ABV6PD14_9MICC
MEKTISLVLADDETMFLGALTSLLGLEEDLQALAAVSNGAEAVAAVKEHRPDVCVPDLEMPELDGIGAAEQIAKSVPCKMIICTRHARPGVLRRALATGVTGFVPKTMPRQSKNSGPPAGRKLPATRGSRAGSKKAAGRSSDPPVPARDGLG